MNEINRKSDTGISANKIEVSYGAENILNGVDIYAEDGKITGIIGPNGSGKSTLLKCIYRTLKAKEGTIMIDGKNIDSMSYKDSARKLSVVAQHNSYSFDFSVEEIVLMGRNPYKKLMEKENREDYDIVYDCLKKVGLEEFSKRMYSTLSGGEQQRVVLARALAQKTKYIVLDEPTNHLDITHQLQIMRLIKESGITAVAAVHDLNIAAMFCDVIYAMKDGKVVSYGKAEEVITPENIKLLYGVESEIVRDKNGKIHILFL